MKKHILISFVIISMIPSFAFAAWWNPLTWKIFKRPVTKIEAPIIKSESINKDQSAEIENLKKEVAALKSKIEIIPVKAVPVPKVEKKPIAAAKKIEQSPVIEEENFKDTLVSFYERKIAFLKQSIALKQINLGSRVVIQEMQDAINFFESNLSTYAGTGYSSSLIQLTTDAISFWKYAIAERTKILAIYQDRVNMWTQVQSRLEKELASTKEQKLISEAEYTLRFNQLQELVNENDLDHAYADQDASISKLLGYLNETDDKLRSSMLTMAKKEKAEADRDLAVIRTQIEIAKNTQIISSAAILTPSQLQPTSVTCETNRRVSGSRSTTCIEFPSMKSMTCESKYNGAGNLINNCYFL